MGRVTAGVWVDPLVVVLPCSTATTIRPVRCAELLSCWLLHLLRLLQPAAAASGDCWPRPPRPEPLALSTH